MPPKRGHDKCATVVKPQKISFLKFEPAEICGHRRSRHSDKGCAFCKCDNFTESR